MPEAQSIWAMIRGGPGDETAAPAKITRDPHALRRPAPGLWPLASAAFGHRDRLGILRVQGTLVTLVLVHVVLHNNNTAVLKEPPA
jgi:hypothetical protein